MRVAGRVRLDTRDVLADIVELAVNDIGHLQRMNDLEKRLVALDLLVARTKPLRDRQETDLKKVKSYKGDANGARELLAKTEKTLKSAKTERRGIIAKLLKAQDAEAKK
jgi:hypothetical protein